MFDDYKFDLFKTKQPTSIMAEPSDWDGVINLSTIDYFVAFVSQDKADEIIKIPGYKFVSPDWINNNYSEYGTYICIDIQDEAWETVLSKFRVKADLIETTGTAACIMFDTEHRALLVEFDE